MAQELVRVYRVEADEATAHARRADDDMRAVLDLARQLATTAVKLEKQTAPLVDMRRHTTLARTELSAEERQKILEELDAVGAVRSALRSQVASLVETVQRLDEP